jgi:hypothetical protein
MSDAVLKLMAKIVTHIPEDGDVTLVILKGHLIIEEELNAAVASRTPHPSFLVEAELEFDQLLLVAKSQYFAQEQSWVWGAAKKIKHHSKSLCTQSRTAGGWKEIGGVPTASRGADWN